MVIEVPDNIQKEGYEAIENYKQVIRLRPDYLEAYNNLGIIYGEIRKFKEALDCFKKIKIINK